MPKPAIRSSEPASISTRPVNQAGRQAPIRPITQFPAIAALESPKAYEIPENQPASASDVAPEPQAPPALPRYQGGAPPIEAVTYDERGRPVRLRSKNTPIEEFNLENRAYNTLFMAEPAASQAQTLAHLVREALSDYQNASWEGALAKIQQALALTPADSTQNATLHAAQAEVFVKQNRLPQAAEALKTAASLAPGRYDLREAQVLVLANRRAEALPILERLHRDKPNNADVAFALGVLLEDLGDAARALDLLKRAAGLHPASADIQYNLALAFELSGNAEEAERHYQQALTLNPQRQDARQALDRLKEPP